MQVITENNKQKMLEEEAGIFLIAFSLLLVGFLAVAALVIDAGNLYNASIALQRAADTAAVGGLSYRARKGWSCINGTDPFDGRVRGCPGKPKDVESRAREIGLFNLQNEGYITNGNEVNVAYTIANDRIAVTVSYPVPLLLMHRILFEQIGATNNSDGTVSITRRSVGELTPANIGLTLDTSGSMNCPDKGFETNKDDPCACRRDNSCASLGNPLKIAGLKSAVKRFISFFNPNQDRINIVPFNMVAPKKEEFGRINMKNSGFTKADLEKAVDSLNAQSSTNPCDGMVESFKDMQRVGVVGREEIFFVLFTDGAPTAGRFRFLGPGKGLNDLMLNARRPLPNDFTHFAIDWIDGGSRTYAGPSSIVATTDMKYNQIFATPLPGIASCGTPIGDLSAINFFTAPFKGEDCVANLSFGVPIDLATKKIPGIPFNSFRQMYYHCAIEISDFIRENRGTLFSIGLGEEADFDKNDPYQKETIDFLRKEIFLRRLAYDPFHSNGPLARTNPDDPKSDPDLDPEFKYSGYSTYQTLNAREDLKDRRGEYYGTDRAAELDNLFVRVAKNIQLNLIQ